MKLWEKGIQTDLLVEKFTVGKDREMDLYLAEFDVLGTLAHIQMLEKIALLEKSDLIILSGELKEIYQQIKEGNFRIEDGVEDVHSQIELMLTRKLGDSGKKVHSGRSRNDQVLLDLKLFTRHYIEEIAIQVSHLVKTLIKLSEKNKDNLMPGYTHFQMATPSSIGLWLGAYAESFTDDLHLLLAAYKMANQNPLGSAAGYGSSFPLDRQMTTDLLGFDSMNYNSIYAQMGRGKTERNVAFALSSIASGLAKLAMDIVMFMSPNFGFITFPDQFTTGSSIMPHKKNPDVFELVRAKCNKIAALHIEISAIITNLPTGYHRDLQIIKENFIPAFGELYSCMDISMLLLNNIIVKDNILKNDLYKYIFSVEEVNKKVLEGVPFRDAYKHVASEIQSGRFQPDGIVHHTHEGSIGNLCNDKIEAKLNNLIASFNFGKVEKAIHELIQA